MRPTPNKTGVEDDNVVDPVEAMLEKTGCIQLHYKVQECIASTQDWRKCQTEVQDFRTCMAEYTKLKLKKQGKIAAQCCHAAIACYRLASKSSPRVLTKWERVGEPKVVLKVSGEEELLALYSTARSRGLIAEIVRDAGHTQVEAGSITVLGIGPGVPSVVDDVVGHLKLL